MRVLVTGATGLLGNNVVRLLLRSGEEVRVLTRQQSDPRPLANLSVEVAPGDLRDQSAVRAACRDVEAIVHSAAVVHIGWSRQDEAHAVNVEGTRSIAEMARELGVRLIHVSTVDCIGMGSPEEYASEDSPHTLPVECPYPITKMAAEGVVTELVQRGLDGVIVNPGFMLGPWDWKPSSGRMLLEVARGRCLLAPRGVNNFCGAEDVAAGIVAAIGKGRTGARYILGDECLTMRQAWQTMADVTGGRAPLGEFGSLAGWIVGACGDLVTRVSGRETDVNSAAIRMASLRKYQSHALATRELGYQPRGLKAAAEAAWEWFCTHGYIDRNH